MQILSNSMNKGKRLKYNGQVIVAASILCITICYLYYVFKGININSGIKIFCAKTDNETEWINEQEIVYSAFEKTDNAKISNTTAHQNLSRKDITILLYTKYYGDDWFAAPEEILTARECNHLKASISTVNGFSSNMFSIPCRIASDRKYFKDSDAVIFHSRDLKRSDKFPHEYRNEKQLWVYLQQESQIYTEPPLENYSNVFNWTMTHRRDSDVYHPYGYLIPRFSDKNSTELNFHSASVTNKTGLVAWIVSHCHPKSKREQFVAELKKYLTVDIFGNCGEPCPTSAVDCYSYVASKYKFYLSFENSLCTDYITEKFYKALSYDMLPIVYGGGKSEAGFSYAEVAPKNSYIDVRSFNDLKELANYILHLNRNDAEFLRFFEWKKKYQVLLASSQNRWCSLCQRLYEHVNKVPSEVKWYKDLWRWWNYVEVVNKLKLRGNTTSSQPSGITCLQRRKKTRACASPPYKLIGKSELEC